MTSQLRRAGVSVPSNIAEGYSRKSSKNAMQFVNISIGSLYECMTQVDIAYELGYISSEDRNRFFVKSEELLKLVNGYKKYMRRS